MKRNLQHKRRNDPTRLGPRASLLTVRVIICLLLLQANLTISQASAPVTDDEDEALELKDRLAIYNFDDSSLEHNGKAHVQSCVCAH